MPKSDHEKAEIRRQTEARRQPDKDRSAHEAARGKKIVLTLKDLTRNDIQDEHIPDITHELDHQSDRGAAMIATALLEVSLTQALMTKLADFEGFEKTIFDGPGAILGSFYSRIKMARALGIAGPQVELHLDTIRTIRNTFAHSAFKIDFQHDLVAAEIEKLLPDNNPEWKPEFTSQRRRFLGTATLLGSALYEKAQEHAADKIDLWLP